MSSADAHSTDRSRGSITTRRIGIMVLALMVAAYLAAITGFLVDQLDSARRITLFTILWLLGLSALALLARAWRHQGQP